MNAQPHCDVNRRHDFIILFDVQDGNPNGDPDAGNQPRMDPETMQGIVTDVSLKRKVRDYVDVAHGDESRYKIYVQRETYLTETRGRVFDERRGDNDAPTPRQAQPWLCEQFYDIRMFGAVMGMRERNAGQVRGPVQLTFSRSIDPILTMDSTIARVALENRGERTAENEGNDQEAPTHGTLGRKSTVPYGLYQGHGFFNPHFAKHTGVNSDDLALFWSALVNMWDLDRSSSRGMMACRGLYVFSHDSALGNAPAHRLFERLDVQRKGDVAVPRRFADYSVTLDDVDLPAGVSVARIDA